MNDYDENVRRQIEQYANTINMHELPPAFHFWSNEYLLPGIIEVFNERTIAGIFTSAVIDTKAKSPQILSVGCGDGGVETEVAKALLARGVTEFKIVGADLSPILLRHFADKIKGFERYFDMVECDLNNLSIPGTFDVVMAHHSLHHFVNLEGLFEFSSSRLNPRGIFAAVDMIGRNGHLRWPETAAVLTEIWPILSEKQRYDVQLRRLNESFTDHNCTTTDPFEGVRAQDILPLLLRYFKPKRFLGAGGFIEVLVERSFGHGFDMNDKRDKNLISLLSQLNDLMLEAGTIRPTMMFAHFQKEDCREISYRGRGAERSIRQNEVGH